MPQLEGSNWVWEISPDENGRYEVKNEEENFTSKGSEIQVLPLTWMGWEIPRVETKLRFNP